MSKVLILGIDGMDAGLIARFEDRLPNLRKLKESSPAFDFRSLYPPDTATAWASIYTGWNPARHGLVLFKDPLEKASETHYADTDNSVLRGNTFWDIAGKGNKKVCLLFPHLGYPIWKVNGIMMGRSGEMDIEKFPIQTFPRSLSQRYELSSLDVVRGMPSRRRYNSFINSWKKVIENETGLGLKMLADAGGDLFFLYSSALDWVQHNFWAHFDEEDSSYPGDTPFKNIIPDFYRLYDEVVGQFLAAVDTDTVVIILSDHGHGRRPTTLVNLNELLREKGLLASRIKRRNYSDPIFAVQGLTRKVADFINRYNTYGVGGAAMKLMRLFPRARKLYTSPLAIDWENTIAYVSDLSGIKAYTYGGIVIRRDKLAGGEYDNIRRSLVKEIAGLRHPDNNEELVKWVCGREDLYQGEFIDKYPDIVFELKDGYGAGWEILGPFISPCRTHNVVPGSHKVDTPVLLMANCAREPASTKVSLMDIAPTVLDILGVEGDFNFDGKSIFLG